MQEEEKIYSISLLNVKIQGEITNLNRRYASGHLYFSLKDKRSEISCVMLFFISCKWSFKLH